MSPAYDDYEPVAARLEKFWTDHAEGRVLTALVTTEPVIIFRCDLYRDPADERPYSTGFAHQQVLTEPPMGRKGPNEFAPEWTSPYEVAETSAIGRALANANYAASADKRPSREEMQAAGQNAVGAGLKKRAVEELVRAGQPTTKQNIEKEMARLSGSGDVGEHPAGPDGEGVTEGNSSSQPEAPSPLPPADAEAKLADTPCARCGRKNTKRVLMGDKVLCANATGCKKYRDDQGRAA